MTELTTTLTIKAILEMPAFKAATVVAGKVGLDNVVRWTHISDIPDAKFILKRRDVLLMTSGYDLVQNDERQQTLIPTLANEGYAGLVLSTGLYLERTPLQIRKMADELDFPIIEMPSDVLFIDLTEAIHAHIISAQYGLLQQSNEIHTQLTDVVLRGGNLQTLAQLLARVLGRSLIIEDPSFRVLAGVRNGKIDRSGQKTIEQSRTTPAVADILLDSGIYDQLRKTMRPQHIAPIPDVGMVMERYVAPIIVDHTLYGYIWLIAGDKPLTYFDELAVDRAATVAALFMFKERAVEEAAESLRGDFLEQLLTGDTQSATFSEQAYRLGYHSDRSHQLLLIAAPTQMGGHSTLLHDEVEGWLREQRIDAFTVVRDETIVLVHEAERESKGKELATRLHQYFDHPAQPLLIGVGTIAQLNDLQNTLRRSYEAAQEAIDIARRSGQKSGVALFSSLGLLHWLYHLPPEIIENNSFLQYIYQLATYDNDRQTELVKTLEAFLDHGHSLIEAAASLHVHRNTLLHRLKRIETLCDVDLRDPIISLNLHVAVKQYRLRQPKQ